MHRITQFFLYQAQLRLSDFPTQAYIVIFHFLMSLGGIIILLLGQPATVLALSWLWLLAFGVGVYGCAWLMGRSLAQCFRIQTAQCLPRQFWQLCLYESMRSLCLMLVRLLCFASVIFYFSATVLSLWFPSFYVGIAALLGYVSALTQVRLARPWAGLIHLGNGLFFFSLIMDWWLYLAGLNGYWLVLFLGSLLVVGYYLYRHLKTWSDWRLYTKEYDVNEETNEPSKAYRMAILQSAAQRMRDYFGRFTALALNPLHPIKKKQRAWNQMGVVVLMSVLFSKGDYFLPWGSSVNLLHLIIVLVFALLSYKFVVSKDVQVRSFLQPRSLPPRRIASKVYFNTLEYLSLLLLPIILLIVALLITLQTSIIMMAPSAFIVMSVEWLFGLSFGVLILAHKNPKRTLQSYCMFIFFSVLSFVTLMKFGFGMNVKTPLFQVGWEYLVVLILLSCINIGFANLSWQRSDMLRHLSFD